MEVLDRNDLKEFELVDGVTGKIVFSSENMMFLLVKIPPKGKVLEHSHPHEQMGICLSGKAKFRSGENERIVEEGMYYWIKSEEKHAVISLVDEDSFFLDVFSPPREDYLEKASRW